jgi:V/A-type H+/Na+-transporting ATPase subunit D
VQWAVTAGVRSPDVATCVLPPENDPAVIFPTSASVQAMRAYRAAVVAAAECAAAQAAFRTVEQEVYTTRLRAHALSRHWLPLLQQELARDLPSPVAIGDTVSLDACVDVGLCCDSST